MSYQIATLIWVLLIIAVIVSGLTTIITLGYGLDESEPKFVIAGVAMIFLTAIIGWGIWIIYPLTAAALGA